MSRRPSVSRRLFLFAAGGPMSGAVLAACTPSQPPQTARPTFIHEAPPMTSPPVKMQRLLLWLPPPPADNFINWKSVSAEFVAELAPYGVAVETGRASALEISRTGDQRALMQQFNPNYRLEIEIVQAHIDGNNRGSAFLRAALYPGASRAVLARFHHYAGGRAAPSFVTQVVAKLKETGYL